MLNKSQAKQLAEAYHHLITEPSFNRGAPAQTQNAIELIEALLEEDENGCDELCTVMDKLYGEGIRETLREIDTKMTNKKCDLCHEKNVTHHIYPPLPNTVRALCCKCYVEEGNPPADWHPDCMRYYKEKQNDH